MATTFVEVTDEKQHRDLRAAGLLWWEDAFCPDDFVTRYVQLPPYLYAQYIPRVERAKSAYGRFGYMVED